MKKNDYQAKRSDLMTQAQAAIDNGELENADKLTEDIKALDALWESTTKAQANLKALTLENSGADVPAIAQAPEVMGAVTDIDPTDTIEYRKAFAAYVASKGRIKMAVTEPGPTKTTDISPVIPAKIINRIVEKLETLGVILPLITRTPYEPGASVPVAGVKPTAVWVAEGATSSKQKVPLGSSIASPSDLITAIEAASVGDSMLSRFTVTTDLTASGTIEVTTPVSARRILYDSALKLYGGELDCFRFLTHYTDRVGQDRGAIIRYGYNAISYLLKRLTDESYNTVIPYYSSEGTYIEGDPLDLVTLSNRDIINDYTRRIAIDLTAHFSTTPTTAEVTAKALELFRKDEDAELYQEAVSASLDVIDLSKTINYRDYIAAGEDIRPGDDVNLVVSREGLYAHFGYFKTKRRITGTVWNVLEEKYSGLEFSEPVKTSESASLADIINATIGKGSTETAAQILSTEPKTEVVQTSSGGGAATKLSGMVPVYYVDQYNNEYLQGHIGGNGYTSGLVFNSLQGITEKIPYKRKETYTDDSGTWGSYSVTHVAYHLKGARGLAFITIESSNPAAPEPRCKKARSSQ